MEYIKNTVYILAVIAVTTGILDILNSTGKLSKYTKYITSLVVIICVLAPFKNFVSDFSFRLEHSEITENFPKKESEEQIKDALTRAISNDLSNKFPIPFNSFKTEIVLNSNKSETLIESVTITITNHEYNRYSERIEYYLKSNYGCEIIIIQNFEE